MDNIKRDIILSARTMTFFFGRSRSIPDVVEFSWTSLKKRDVLENILDVQNYKFSTQL